MKKLVFFTLSIVAFLESCNVTVPEETTIIDNNVQSIQYEVYKSDWKGDSSGYYTELSLPEITDNIYNNGAVLLYVLEDNAKPKYKFQLPYTYINDSVAEYMDADYYVGRAKITYKKVDKLKNATVVPEEMYVFKIIIIPGEDVSMLPGDNTKISFEALNRLYSIKQ